MALYKFTMTFESVTELPEDAIVNTWWFDGSGSDFENVDDMLIDFFTEVPSGAVSHVSSFMSDDVITGNVLIKAYDMSDPEPRTPVHIGDRTLPNLGTTNGMPSEVALCLSYHAAPVSGVPSARLRGRVYLGPWTVNPNVAGRPSTTVVSVIASAARDLLQASNASVSWTWVQNSPTRGEYAMVVGGWVDNSWDTQRRRGWETTARTSWTGGTP